MANEGESAKDQRESRRRGPSVLPQHLRGHRNGEGGSRSSVHYRRHRRKREPEVRQIGQGHRRDIGDAKRDALHGSARGGGLRGGPRPVAVPHHLVDSVNEHRESTDAAEAALRMLV